MVLYEQNIKELKDIADSKVLLTQSDVDRMGDIIQKFSSEKVKVEQAQNILDSIGRTMELDANNFILYAQSVKLLESLIRIIADFRYRIFADKKPPKNYRFSCYSSHHCFEIAIFMLLCLVEKSYLLVKLVKTIPKKSLFNLLDSIGDIFSHDLSYVTQVIDLITFKLDKTIIDIFLIISITGSFIRCYLQILHIL
jgi:hypothetical protein